MMTAYSPKDDSLIASLDDLKWSDLPSADFENARSGTATLDVNFSDDEFVAGIEFLKPQQNIVNDEGIGWSSKLIFYHLKDMFEAASVININIDDALIALHEKCELKVSMVFTSLEASGIFETSKLRREMMQRTADWVKEPI